MNNFMLCRDILTGQAYIKTFIVHLKETKKTERKEKNGYGKPYRPVSRRSR
jgi:hypothetical protein